MKTHQSGGERVQEGEENEMALRTFDELRKYIGSSIFPQVGPITAKNIVSTFGVRTIQVIEESSHELYSVRGVGSHRATTIIDSWATPRRLKKTCMILMRERTKE